MAVAKKGTEDIRLCIDRRKLNASIEDVYVLNGLAIIIGEAIEEMGYHTKGIKYFAKLDLCQGYNALRVSNDSKKYLAITSQGRHRHVFLRCPFGLKTAPAVFKNMMHVVLKDHFKECVCYFDDIIAFGGSIGALKDRLDRIFDAIIGAKLKLKPFKSKFGTESVEILKKKILRRF